ncbi:hypothetical protein RUM43_014139 [Polyplax serrata]|uniref:CHHC U11-48K-type domain-containing protein n=1 Tax=Polyplax serrata TaxID=468196 RepID=A0AAN8S706_POLSC
MNEEFMHCPYNFAHVLLKHRMAAHLIKCRKQYVGNEFATCPFNSTHDVPAPELEFHIDNCRDRRKLDSVLYTTDDISNCKPHESFHVDLPPSDENWDMDQISTASYLDVKNKVIEKQPLFRVPVGLTKSKRKIFLHEEEKRFENLSENSST